MVFAAPLLALAAPLVIAHRGASALRPEHTLEAYQLAIDAGADYIEPDLVITKDGVLVARHENEISGTTDVANRPEFASRRTTKEIDGAKVTGWFTEDFTIIELKTLRAKERIPQLRPESAKYDGKFQIPTFSQVVELAKKSKRRVGVCPETKHPSYFRSIGLPLEPALLEVLNRYGWNDKNAPVMIQSFEVGNLWALSKQTPVQLVQLLNTTGKPYDFEVIEDERSYADLAKPNGLKFIKSYADIIGVNKDMLIPRQGGVLGTPSSLIADAKREKLKVVAWTFRDEDAFLPSDLKGNAVEELRRFFALGIDGVFADNPATALAARPK